jgi:hypothetical protein
MDFGRWRRDSDGIFRDIDREVEVWNRKLAVGQFDLPQWDAVLGAVQSDVRLARQIDTLVGTAHGGRRVEAETIGRISLSRPDEVSHVAEAFERRYARTRSFPRRRQDRIHRYLATAGPGRQQLSVSLGPGA